MIYDFTMEETKFQHPIFITSDGLVIKDRVMSIFYRDGSVKECFLRQSFSHLNCLPVIEDGELVMKELGD